MKDNNMLEIQKNINNAKKYGLTVILVEADLDKGYNYPYILCYPDRNMKNTFVMNCLNDYEQPFFENETENLEAVEEIYRLFGENRIQSEAKANIKEKKQEDKEKSLDRLSYRMQRATNSLSTLVTNFSGAPILMPLIPGFKSGEEHENIASELGAGVAKELAPQILAMIDNAREIASSRTGIKFNDKVISYGHSKESTFADHFSALHPDKIEATILGGTEYATLPVEEIRLIIDNNRSDNEQFEVREGIPYKKITSEEFSEIMQEYRENKKDNQGTISLNQDGSYSLPMNYPLGIADIEQYIGEFPTKEAKDEYLKSFAQTPKMIFVGEDEEKVDGHYAYSSGTTLEGIEIESGQDLAPFEKHRPLFEIENASMHNRVLDYVSAQRVLFGKSANQRLSQYMDLANKLELNTQSKIYANVGHTDIYRSKALSDDLNKTYENLVENNTIPVLSNNDRALRISPVYQLMRRYLVSASREEFDSKNKTIDGYIRKNRANDRVSERKNIVGGIQKAVDNYMIQKYNVANSSMNMDNIYDKITTTELEGIFEKTISNEKNQERKTISIKSFILNALTKGTATEHVVDSYNIENAQRQSQQKEGVTKDE